MGLSLLPDELLLTLSEQWPCRENQIRHLAALFSPIFPTPSTVVVHGPHASGKSSIVASHLQAIDLRHAIVRCRECVTGRHLLERITEAVHQSLKRDGAEGGDVDFTARCENLSALTVNLQRLLKNENKFVLVLDGVEKQREAPPTLLPALARLGEFIPNLHVVLIVQHPSPRFLHRTGVPHIHFPPYTRNQSIHIVSQQAPDIFVDPPAPGLEYEEDVHEEDKAWLWPRFCAAVWDSLAQSAARDLVAFRQLCHKLWRPFVAPIVKGEFGTRDFSRLLVNQRVLFQDERVLLGSIVPESHTMSTTTTLSNGATEKKSRTHELPYYAKWLLVAAYLASFNPPKQDVLYFMKSSERKKRKKGGRPPSQKHRKIARHLLAPSAFTLDRLLAILHAILPHDFRSTIDVYSQVATLTALRLLVRSAGGLGSGDVLEAGAKWRIGPAVSWEYVLRLARIVGFEVGEYLAE